MPCQCPAERGGEGRAWRGGSSPDPRHAMHVPRRRRGPVLGSAAGGRSGGPCGRTRYALVTRYAFGDDTIGSRGFIAAVTQTAGPRPFGGAGL